MKASLIQIVDIDLYINYIILDEEEKNFRWYGFAKEKQAK